MLEVSRTFNKQTIRPSVMTKCAVFRCVVRREAKPGRVPSKVSPCGSPPSPRLCQHSRVARPPQAASVGCGCFPCLVFSRTWLRSTDSLILSGSPKPCDCTHHELAGPPCPFSTPLCPCDCQSSGGTRAVVLRLPPTVKGTGPRRVCKGH